MTTTTEAANNVSTSSPLTIALSWLVVIVPATWGIYVTALRAVNLFH